MKLTKAQIQQIIKEELEALQEIGDLSGVERDKDLTAMGQKQQAAFDAASSDADKLIAAGEPYMMPSSPKFSQNRVMKTAPMTDRQWKDFFLAGLETVYLITLELTMEEFGQFLDKSLVQAELLEAAKVIAKYVDAGKGMQTKADFDKLYNDPRYNRQYLAALSLMLRIANAHFGTPIMMVSSYNGSVMRVDNIEIEKNPEGVNGKAVTKGTAARLEDAFQERIREIVKKLKPDYLKHLEKFGSFGFAFDDDEKDAVPKQLSKMGFKESLRRLEIKEKQIIESFDRAAKKSNFSLTKTDLQKIIREELDALEEYNTGMGGGYDQAQDSFDRFAGQRRRKADEEEKLKIIRKAERGRRDKEELASMAKADAEDALEHDEAIANRDRVVAMYKKKIGFASGLPSVIGQVQLAGDLKQPEMIQSQSFIEDMNRNLIAAMKSHKRAKQSEAPVVFNALVSRLEKIDPNGEWQDSDVFKQAQEKLVPKKKGLLGLGGRFLGLEENMTLTSEELQTIIQQEIENITKGN